MTDLAYLLTGAPSERITWRTRTTTSGKPIYGSRRTIAHLQMTDDAAIEKFGTGLVVFQGAYNTTVSASAGSHDLDAAIDLYLPGVDWLEAQRFLRELGWAAWWRHTGSFADNQHIHMITLGYETPVGYLIPGQVSDYYRRLDGLAGHAIDDTWHPASIDSTIFDYPAWKAGQDDMFETDDRKRLERIENEISDLAAAEAKRAKDARDRDRRNGQTIRKAIKAGKLEVLAALADELDPPG